jgi:hypothetical protein
MTAAPVEAMQKLALDFDHAAPSGPAPFVADPWFPDDGLTSDNLHLSEPILSPAAPSIADIADSESASDAEVLEFLQAARSSNTRLAYKCDIEHFLAWGGRLPATDRVIARYLADHAGLLAIATLRRRLVAIRSAHVAHGLQDPTKSELVRLTFCGIRRMHGRPERRVAALCIADLQAIVSALSPSTRWGIDQIGKSGALRRKPLPGLFKKVNSRLDGPDGAF